MSSTDVAAVVVAARAAGALSERLALVTQAFPTATIVCEDRWTRAASALPSEGVVYLVDVNGLTAPLATVLRTRRQPFVVDTGDDIGTLTTVRRGVAQGRAFSAVEGLVLRGARAVVHRGSFHGPLLRQRTAAALHWAPDTVGDAVIDQPLRDMDPTSVATFGTAAAPRFGDQAYGWEVVDVVARTIGATGLIVARGPGRHSLEARAARLGVAHRVAIEGPLPLEDLLRRVGDAAFLTSVQSDDRAGWVRTTGKLPLALGMGKALLSTRVGEASRLLPDELLVTAESPEATAQEMAAAVRAGVPSGWPARAKELAETFRRSTVARELAAFLRGVP